MPALLTHTLPPLYRSTGCTQRQSATISFESCKAKCFTKTIGYWQTHGTQLANTLSKLGSVTLWGRTYSASAVSVLSTPNKCAAISTSPDALWALCAEGQSVCR